jgi:hypothetical protein
MEDVLIAVNRAGGNHRKQIEDPYVVLTNNLAVIKERIENERREQEFKSTNKLPLKIRFAKAMHNFCKGIRDWSWKTWVRIVLVVVIFIALLLSTIFLREYISRYLNIFLEWVKNQGLIGVLVFAR